MSDQNTNQRAAIYVRVSTNNSSKEENNFDVQIETCRSALEKQNLSLYKVYFDKGVSEKAKANQRPELQQLYEDAKSGHFNTVVFYSVDRIGRNCAAILNILDDFKTLGLSYFSCKERLNSSNDKANLFQTTIVATITQYEKDVRKETKDRLKNMK